MKILTAAQTQQFDQATIREQGITSAQLMERAAQALLSWFYEQFGHEEQTETLLLCGPGNNGGDGLALARLLHEAGFRVRVALLPATRQSADWLHNRQRLPEAVPVADIIEGNLPAIAANTVVIDALFGTGLSRPLTGLAAAVVTHLNKAHARVAAVDLPSGLFAEAPQPADSAVVRARHTVSFGLLKLAFLLPQNAKFVGEWFVKDIGLSERFIAEAATPWHYTDAATMAHALPPRPKFSHKGTFGHALLLAGSRGKMGAAVLAAGACLRGGVGLLTAHIPGCGYDIFQISQPEAMCLTDAQLDFISELPDLKPYQAAGIGPGLGQHDASRAVLRQLLEAAAATETRPKPLPLIIDADALNLLGQHRELLELLPENTVLTPHPKEFERLTEPARDDYHRLDLLRDFAQKHRCLVVLKGAYTCLATPTGELHFNSTGNPGMATGGSGDVLTGLLLALRAHAQLPAFEAVRLGVFAHGRAGDLAAAETGQAGLVAGDIVRHIGPALAGLIADGSGYNSGSLEA
ncbi:bifunctional ADP-dependent NAD(P)H-hydrate dehydratase/NAD(P)H-hydrate epimerase [Hymenobacter terrenus]|uniref:bifunctional ADP-dependent NAD(P)H-hydrate dehydratase/NAD(P)H-hydrate epimerase n=1 Tax=Hymenobacter terrenus TaxID=1629124 RepID=UPI000619D5D1|nr:bifunctional ADP-dependent NAD(P)H-hydrate dehydratase/NAD(P)H-hydrate epimerase [Hymenobacter terrenus]